MMNMTDYDEEDIQRKELRRLLGSARHATRKQAIENSLNELDSRSASLYRQHSALTSASPILEEKTEDGNSGLCTPPSKTLTRSHSDSLKPYKDHRQTNSFSLLNENGPSFGGNVKTLRPSSAANTRQRRPSFQLDAIPEGINEHRPNSNYNKSNGMVSSPKLSYKKELFVKKVHNGPVITLNLNGFSPDAVTSSHCNVVDIVGSCFYDPQVTYSFCKRITSSSPLGLLYGSVHTPPLQSPGAHDDAQQEQEFENKKQTIVNWVCTGLCPQYLVMSLDTTYCIKDITIECYGRVNQVNIRLYNCSVTGSLSGSTPVLLAPGLMECTRTMDIATNSYSFRVNVEECRDNIAKNGRSSDRRNIMSSSDCCNQICFTITDVSDVFFGITNVQIRAQEP